jgi:hypothetical protein
MKNAAGFVFFHYFFVATEGNRGYMHGNGEKRSFHSLEVASAMEYQSIWNISLYDPRLCVPSALAFKMHDQIRAR